MDPLTSDSTGKNVDGVESVLDNPQDGGKQGVFFSPKIKIILIINLIVLLIGWFDLILWLYSVGVAVVTVVLMLMVGLIQGVRKRGYKLVSVSLLFFVIFVLIGFGTCVFNMGL